MPALCTWTLLAHDDSSGLVSLTEFIQFETGALFRETVTSADGVASVALTFAPGVMLEDPNGEPGPRLVRP